MGDRHYQTLGQMYDHKVQRWLWILMSTKRDKVSAWHMVSNQWVSSASAVVILIIMYVFAPERKFC